MEQEVRERVTLPIGDIEHLFTNDGSALAEQLPRSGFNFNKLLAVACMLSSALVSIAFIAWWFLA